MNKLVLTAWVLACAGCAASTGSKQDEERLRSQYKEERVAAELSAAHADKAAGRTDGVTASATVTYWLGLKAALHPVPIKPEVAAKDIDHLPTRGVDPELVRQGQIVVEKMRAAATSIQGLSGFEILFHIHGSRLVEAAGKAKIAVEQCQAVERMRPELTARYGVEFPTLDVPTP